MKYPSVFDGYLTPECSECDNWSDGSDGRGAGCNTSVPIDWCPAFKRVMEECERLARKERNGAAK